MKKLEAIFHEINDFGKYQHLILFYICFCSLIAPIATYLNSFVASNPDHICAPPHNFQQKDSINSEINQCTIVSNGTTMQCESWEFDRTYYHSTLTEDWGLVCQYSFLRAYIQTIYFLGVLIGSIFFGKLSDSFGRRPVILIGILLMNIGSIGAVLGVQNFFGFHVNYVVYTLCGFLIAFGTRGPDEAGYALALEFVGPTKKAISGIIIECFFALGHIVLVVAAYFLRDWKNLSIFLCIFNLPFLIYFKLIPESPRWLISKDRRNEAYNILSDIANTNHRELTREKWQEFCDDSVFKTTSLHHHEQEDETFVQIIKYPYFVLVFVSTVGLWCVINIIFYGIGIKTNDLGINPYMSFFSAGVLELIACICTFFFIDRSGRKTIFIVTSIVITVCAVGVVFIEDVLVSIVLAMIIKFAATVNFSVLRVYTNEIFPTTIRVSCIGASSTISRLGVVTSPILNALGDKYWKPLPFAMFGALSVLSVFISFIIPETVGKTPAENLKEFDALFKYADKLNVVYNDNELKCVEEMTLSQKDEM